jgi:hypothetical protein
MELCCPKKEQDISETSEITTEGELNVKAPQGKEVKKEVKKSKEKKVTRRDLDRYYLKFWDAVDIVRIDEKKTDELKKLPVIKAIKKGKKFMVSRKEQNAYEYYKFFTHKRLSRTTQLNGILESQRKLYSEIETCKEELTKIKLSLKAKQKELSRLISLEESLRVDDGTRRELATLYVDHFSSDSYLMEKKDKEIPSLVTPESAPPLDEKKGKKDEKEEVIYPKI